MICPTCSTPNETEYVFCVNCGTSLVPSAVERDSVATAYPAAMIDTPPNKRTNTLLIVGLIAVLLFAAAAVVAGLRLRRGAGMIGFARQRLPRAGRADPVDSLVVDVDPAKAARGPHRFRASLEPAASRRSFRRNGARPVFDPRGRSAPIAPSRASPRAGRTGTGRGRRRALRPAGGRHPWEPMPRCAPRPPVRR